MPDTSIQDLVQLRKERDEFGSDYERRERSAVLRARRVGLPWQEIAEALGRTRSAVWQKYHHHDPGAEERRAARDVPA